MKHKTLSFSIACLVVALLGGAVLGFNIWSKRVPPPVADGRVGETEYARTLVDELTGMTMAWSITGDELHMALTAPGQGWVAVGIDPDDAVSTMMLGADYILGYVDEAGQVVVEDQFGNTKVSHRADTRGDGTVDVTVVGGSQDEHGTTLEFVRALDTGDERDKPIRRDKLFVQLAYAPEDDFFAYHAEARNTVRVDFFEGGVINAIEHLEAFEVALLIWAFLFGLLGLQGVISTYLEGEVLDAGAHPTGVPSWAIMIAMVALTVANVWAVAAFVGALFGEAEPQALGQLAALMLLLLAILVGFYRRFFVDHVVVAQPRQDGVPW